ncbi:NAD(P)/FAD-dependent oxidoreductase [Amphibacillus jilinensis]|uniref:NAD(P)/FAD-dependent oxidoreductase n=1 Tax=Amphibacillus jilinensis TaxID=1216008 RepID=UPI00031AF2C3|nr:NAD(P)/FAD-dependent oxidoreductase [Amphibacillus jilinensis]
MSGIELYDTTIIGGGPAGLYAAFYSGLREMKTKIIESQSELGGKVRFYQEKKIWDVGAIPVITGYQLIEQMTEQARTFSPTIVFNQTVTSIRQMESGTFLLETRDGSEHLSKTVIVAVGSGVINPNKLTLDGAERFEQTNLHYQVKPLEHYRNRTVLISGGGNSAIDWANELSAIAKKVYLVYRKDLLKGHEASVSTLLNGKATCLLNTEMVELIASDCQRRISQVVVKEQITSRTQVIDVDDVLVNHGYEQIASLLDNSDLPIERKDNFYIKGTAYGNTSVAGVFGAGDIMNYDGKLNLIAGAFQDAAHAVNQAKRFIQPQADKVAMVSSANEVFKKLK